MTEQVKPFIGIALTSLFLACLVFAPDSHGAQGIGQPD